MRMLTIHSSERLWTCHLLNRTQATIELRHLRQQAGITTNAEGMIMLWYFFILASIVSIYN